MLLENIQFFSLWMEKELNYTHRASDRKIFSMGALNAAKWVYDKKNLVYTTMLDMIS